MIVSTDKQLIRPRDGEEHTRVETIAIMITITKQNAMMMMT